MSTERVLVEQTCAYQVFTNVSAVTDRERTIWSFDPGDHLIPGWSGRVPVGASPLDTLERIFRIHNRDDRPDGQDAPSLSVSDVVCLGGVYWWVTVDGFDPVPADEPLVLLDTTYREWLTNQ